MDTNQNIPPEELYKQPGAQGHKKSWFTLHHTLMYIVFALLFLAVVAGAYYYQVSQSVPDITPPVHHAVTSPTADTSTWKTYTNSQYGFSFQYPSDLTYTESTKNNSSNQEWLTVYFFGSDKNLAVFSVDINAEALAFGEGCSQQSIKEIKVIDNISMAREDDCGEISYSFSNSNNLFIFDAKNYENNEFDQILSTFKFTDSNDAADNSSLNRLQENFYTEDYENSGSHLVFDSPNGGKVVIPDNVAITIDSNVRFAETKNAAGQDLSGLSTPVDPTDPDLFYLTTTEENTDYSQAINRVYSYNVKTSTLTKIFEITDRNNDPMDNAIGRVLRSVGIDGDKIILLADDYDNSPGPCTDIWSDYKDRMFYLQLDNISAGLKQYMVPQDLVDQGVEFSNQCQASL